MTLLTNVNKAGSNVIIVHVFHMLSPKLTQRFENTNI